MHHDPQVALARLPCLSVSMKVQHPASAKVPISRNEVPRTQKHGAALLERRPRIKRFNNILHSGIEA